MSDTAIPRVSVVLPAYNRADSVARAIDSVLAQTFGDLELIVVDDASRDGTRAVLEGYRAEPRVRLILSDINRGGSGARNLGVAAARAPLIAFQDSDDVWLPHKLAAQVAALDADPGAGLCYCAALFAAGARTSYLPPTQRFAHMDGDMSREVLKSSPVSTQMLLVRRTALAAARAAPAPGAAGHPHAPDTAGDHDAPDTAGDTGPFDETLKRFQDWDLAIRLAQVTRFAFLPEPLVVIHETAGNISSVKRNDPIARAALLEKYAALFAKTPRAAAKHHYIVARSWQKLGERGRARAHFAQALRHRLGR